MSTDLATHQQGSVHGGVAVVRETMETLKSIRTFIKSELRENLDYGVIPGTGSKAALLQPGAQKIAMFFNTTPDHVIDRNELGGGHVEFIITTRLVHRSTGQMIGSGVGSCTTKEKKYRLRKAERVCPRCQKPAIIKGKEEYGGGWVCFDKKGGCKAKFRDDDPAIAGQNVGEVENPDIYDARNTVLKMAVKRSFVAASLSLGCLAELFTQDIDETYDMSGTADAYHADPQPRPPHQPRHDESPRDEGRREVNAAFSQPDPEGSWSGQRPDRTQSDHTGHRQDGGNKFDGQPPRSGKALFAWTKDQEQKYEVGLLKYLNSWAKLHEFPPRMVDWDADQVAQAHTEAVRKLASHTDRGDAYEDALSN